MTIHIQTYESAYLCWYSTFKVPLHCPWSDGLVTSEQQNWVLPFPVASRAEKIEGYEINASDVSTRNVRYSVIFFDRI